MIVVLSERTGKEGRKGSQKKRNRESSRGNRGFQFLKYAPEKKTRETNTNKHEPNYFMEIPIQM